MCSMFGQVRYAGVLAYVIGRHQMNVGKDVSYNVSSAVLHGRMYLL